MWNSRSSQASSSKKDIKTALSDLQFWDEADDTLLVPLTTGQYTQREHKKILKRGRKAAGPPQDLERQVAGSLVLTHILSYTPDEGCVGAGNLRRPVGWRNAYSLRVKDQGEGSSTRHKTFRR